MIIADFVLFTLFFIDLLVMGVMGWLGGCVCFMVVLLTLFDIVCCCYEGLVGVLFADLIGRVFG